MKLDIGSGGVSPEGYLKHDIRPLEGLDYVCDISELVDRVGKESCEAVRASHVLEHFGIREQERNFGIIYDLLKPNGTVDIIVPNFVWHAKILLEGREDDAVYYAFGGQEDEYDFHKYGFTPDNLYGWLEKAGFKDIRIQDGSSIEASARK